MEVNQFISELKTCLATLEFVDKVFVEQKSFTYVKIKVTLKPKGFLNIWYNSVKRTQSFGLILESSRKWGLDFDNRIGWHEHPIENPEMHISQESHSISEIVIKLRQVWNSNF